MYTMTAQTADDFDFNYSVQTTELSDGSLMVYVIHELLSVDMVVIEAQVGVSVQFNYDTKTEKFSEIACSFENNDISEDEKKAITDYLICTAIDDMKSIYNEDGEYRYINDGDQTLSLAPIRSPFVLSDLSAELNAE